MSEELQQLVPIEEQISQELVKHNVTNAVILNLKEKYGHLKISGIDDKETYLLVKEGRKECKAFRVAAKKICEKGREEAVAISKAWVSKQKEVTDVIASIEDPLEAQEKEFEAAVAKDKEDRKRRQEEQLIIRQQVLSAMGVLYSEGAYALGEVSFELSVIKETEPDIWEESILPKFKEEYEKVEAERIEQDRIKMEREVELKRQQDELLQKQKELAEKEAVLKKIQEEQERKRIEEENRIQYKALAKISARFKDRLAQVVSIGFVYDGIGKYNFHEFTILSDDIHDVDDKEWSHIIINANDYVTEKKSELEQKRLAEIEEQKEATRRDELRKSRLLTLKRYERAWIHGDIVDPSDELWDKFIADVKTDYEKAQKEKWEKEQEEKRQQDEVVRLQKLDSAKDKEKWDEILRKVNEIEVYDMRSQQYRKKAMILREKLEEIKSL